MAKGTGLPLVPGLDDAISVPHTISYAIAYRRKIDSFNELPKEKQPPRNLWDKPFKLSEFIDHVFDEDFNKNGGKKFVEFDMDDIE